MHRQRQGSGSAGVRRIGLGLAAAAVSLWAAVPAGPARAQLLNQLEGAIGGGAGGALPAVNQASPLNIAGVLQYCIQNSLLGGGGGAASSVQQSLLGHAGGAGATSNPQYTQGASGILQTGQGQGFNLGGGGIVADLKQKVCNMVLQQAKSLL